MAEPLKLFYNFEYFLNFAVDAIRKDQKDLDFQFSWKSNKHTKPVSESYKCLTFNLVETMAFKFKHPDFGRYFKFYFKKEISRIK